MSGTAYEIKPAQWVWLYISIDYTVPKVRGRVGLDIF